MLTLERTPRLREGLVSTLQSRPSDLQDARIDGQRQCQTNRGDGQEHEQQQRAPVPRSQSGRTHTWRSLQFVQNPIARFLRGPPVTLGENIENGAQYVSIVNVLTRNVVEISIRFFCSVPLYRVACVLLPRMRSLKAMTGRGIREHAATARIVQDRLTSDRRFGQEHLDNLGDQPSRTRFARHVVRELDGFRPISAYKATPASAWGEVAQNCRNIGRAPEQDARSTRTLGV